MPQPAPDQRVIVDFWDADRTVNALMARDLDDLEARERAGGKAAAVNELVAEIVALTPDMTVLTHQQYAAEVAEAARALAPELLSMGEGGIPAALDAFERRYPGMADRPRRAALELDRQRRLDELRAADDTETRVRLLEAAADDYGITSHPELRPVDELWVNGDPPLADVDDRDPAANSEPARGQRRFRMLRGDTDEDSAEPDDEFPPETHLALYMPLIRFVEQVDPQAAARAPRDVDEVELGSPQFSLEAAEVVSIMVPAFAGVFADRIVDAAARWLRRRRQPYVARQTVELYGPDGKVLRTVTVSEGRDRPGLSPRR